MDTDGLVAVGVVVAVGIGVGLLSVGMTKEVAVGIAVKVGLLIGFGIKVAVPVGRTGDWVFAGA